MPSDQLQGIFQKESYILYFELRCERLLPNVVEKVKDESVSVARVRSDFERKNYWFRKGFGASFSRYVWSLDVFGEIMSLVEYLSKLFHCKLLKSDVGFCGE